MRVTRRPAPSLQSQTSKRVPTVTAPDASQNNPSTETDILIVGAGMAGLYSAWRLQRAGYAVRIVEQLHRVGGRLQTDHVRINDQMIEAEEGGMRFMKTQRQLLTLIEQLNLAVGIMPFPMGSADNLYYLRERRFTVRQAQADPSIWGQIYRLDPGSKGKQPGQILWDIRNSILLQNAQNPDTWESSPENWTQFRLEYTYNGIALYRWGFWALLDDFGLSQDCIEMLYSSSGFIAPYDQLINAGSAFQLVADFINPNFLALRGGYATLPAALATQLRAHRVPIDLDHEVRAVERLDDGRFRVVARHRNQDLALNCRKLILAVTQLGLRRLAPFAPMLRDNGQFMTDIDAVADMPLGKINLFYPRNWWTARLGIRNGPCFTDLALAMVYFFERPDSAAEHDGAGHITIYTDLYRSNFWTELQALGDPFHSKEFPVNPPNTQAASRAVVTAVTRQMKQLFGIDDIPEPVLTTFKDWIDPRFGDGDHSWRIGVVDAQVRERLRSPAPGVHVCGESFSDDQAWVNGALRSVDEMLAAHFGLDPMPFLAQLPDAPQ